MKKFLVAAVLTTIATPAFADALVDNVDGMTLDADGKVVRFTGLLMTPDGHVARLLKQGEKRPDKLDWRADMKGKVLLPYTGPHPPPFQIHHYILWVLEQEGKAPTRPLHDRFQQVDLGIPLKVVYKSYFLLSSSPP
jgi:hypothetical protein